MTNSGSTSHDGEVVMMVEVLVIQSTELDADARISGDPG